MNKTKQQKHKFNLFTTLDDEQFINILKKIQLSTPLIEKIDDDIDWLLHNILSTYNVNGPEFMIEVEHLIRQSKNNKKIKNNHISLLYNYVQSLVSLSVELKRCARYINARNKNSILI